jgi:hypothetical protein
MNDQHRRLRRLVLGCDDLDGALREQALAHLEECRECRELRARVLAAEEAFRSVEPLPEIGPPADAEAAASLDRLLKTGRTSRLPRVGTLVPLALAAGLALVLLGPLLGPSGPVRDLQMGAPLVLRGHPAAGDALLQGVSFRLEKPGYPVLVHIDGAGDARLVHPRSPEEPAPCPAGERVFLPPPGPPGTWRTEPAPGCETYVLAVADLGSPPSAGSLAALLLDASSGSRRDAVAEVRRRLNAAFGNAAVCNGPDCR